MNHITCEKCGTQIDVDKNKKCPKCKSDYSKNKEYLTIKKTVKKNEKDIDDNNPKVEKKLVIGYVAAILLIIVTLLVIFNFISRTYKTESPSNTLPFQDPNEKVVLDENDAKTEITVGFDETASTDQFEIKISEIKIHNIKANLQYDPDNKSYGFYVTFKNKTDDWLSLTGINLVYTDAEGNENVIARETFGGGDSRLPSLATETATYTGYKYFEFPEYVLDVKIIYENVTIKLDNFQNKITYE